MIAVEIRNREIAIGEAGHFAQGAGAQKFGVFIGKADLLHSQIQPAFSGIDHDLADKGGEGGAKEFHGNGAFLLFRI